jgi:hypothetical protein
MVKKSVGVLVLCLVTGSWCVAASAPLTVTLPDGNLTVSAEIKSNPQPYLQGSGFTVRLLIKVRQFFAARLWDWILLAHLPWTTTFR